MTRSKPSSPYADVIAAAVASAPAYLKKKSRDELIAECVGLQKEVDVARKDAREAQNEVLEAREERDKYGAIARAVNFVAHRKVLADRFLPHVPSDFGSRERVRFVTHPQALAEVLRRLADVADEVDGVFEVQNEDVKEIEEERDDLKDERDQLLARLGIDAYEWNRLKYCR